MAYMCVPATRILLYFLSIELMFPEEMETVHIYSIYLKDLSFLLFVWHNFSNYAGMRKSSSLPNILIAPAIHPSAGPSLLIHTHTVIFLSNAHAIGVADLKGSQHQVSSVPKTIC